MNLELLKFNTKASNNTIVLGVMFGLNCALEKLKLFL